VKIKFFTYFTTVLLVLLSSCDENEQSFPIYTSNTEKAHSYSIEQRDRRPTIIGEKKNNPFSVENMRNALDTLRYYSETDELLAPSLRNSDENIEKSLSTQSITEFRDNLIAKYPSLRTKITNFIDPYL